MKKFGEDNEFSIWVDYYYIKYKNDPYFIEHQDQFEMSGEVYFWVHGKNLFEFIDCPPEDNTYRSDLNILIDFFSSYLRYHISDDPFPAKTIATSAIDMLDEVKLIEGEDNDLNKWIDLDWDKVDMELQMKIDRWIGYHGMLTNRGGSFLPDAYIRRKQNKIEISWDNNFSHKGQDREFYFKHKKSVELIDLKLYRDTVVAFCKDFISRFDKKYPDRMRQYNQELQKAMEINFIKKEV